MADRTTTFKPPNYLHRGSIVLCNPDSRDERHGEAGRWIVTADPQTYHPFVRVDYEDAETRNKGVWVLPSAYQVAVELTGADLQEKAADLLGWLMRERLPLIHTWTIDGERVCAQMAGGFNEDQARADLAIWQEHLGADEITETPLNYGTRIAVHAIAMEVPIEVWTTVRTERANRSAADASNAEADE